MDPDLSKNIVIIGSGTGGPNALKVILYNLPKLKASFVIVQHMSRQLQLKLTKMMDEITEMDVKLAEKNDELLEGTIFIAPDGKQLTIKDNYRISFENCDRDRLECPSIDLTMKSLSVKKDYNILGIILSGIGKDGCEGIEHISSIGGTTIAQNVSTSIISHMPENAIDTGEVDFIFRPIAIRSKIIQLFKKG